MEAMCKGSIRLGTACLKCPSCERELERLLSSIRNPKEIPDIIKSGKTCIMHYQNENYLYTKKGIVSIDHELNEFQTTGLISEDWEHYGLLTITDEISLLRPLMTNEICSMFVTLIGVIDDPYKPYVIEYENHEVERVRKSRWHLATWEDLRRAEAME